MSINNKQLIDILSRVVHPIIGDDLISLDMIKDISVQDKMILFTVGLTDQNIQVKNRVKKLCEDAIQPHLDPDTILDIRLTYSPPKAQENHNPHPVETKKAERLNPMNMSLSDANNFVPPTTIDQVPYEKMPLMIRQFMDEHKKAIEEIDLFEQELLRFKKERWVMDQSMNQSFGQFFSFFDNNILDHNRREEKKLFPLLQKRLIESGEHSAYEKYFSNEASHSRTAVELMEDEHIKFIQLSTLVFNFLSLAHRLPDIRSQSMVSDLAYEQGLQLIEVLRLHIQREDQTLFPLAANLISEAEFAQMAEL